MGNVLVSLNLHGCDLQEATNRWIIKTLVNKPKQELQRDYEWTKVSSDMKNTTTYEKLTSDNGKRTIFLIKMALSKSASYANLQVEVWKSQNKKKENAYAHQIQINLDSSSNIKTKLRRNTNLKSNY